MRRVLNIAKTVMIAALFLSMPITAFAAGEEVVNMPTKQEVSITKPWTAKFNLELDVNTINDKNILVKDSKGNNIKVTVVPGKDPKTITIYPPTGGYIPGESYSLELSKAIKNKNGKNLSKVTKMSFKTSNQYEDSTNYSSLPSIKGIEILNQPILQNKGTSFRITPNSSEDVQYRVYLFKYPDETYDNPNTYSNTSYIELTNGYTNVFGTSTPYIFTKQDGFHTGKYKFLVYIKGKGRVGQNKDTNTDFDNYYSTYFRVIDKDITKDSSSNATISYIKYDKTLEQAALEEYSEGAPVYSEKTGWMRPSKEIIKYYMNPYNFLDEYYKDAFLKLSYMEIPASDLNNVLKGKGVLEGKGAVFLQAAKENNINPIYLIGHALLETGNGTSSLATGVTVTSVDGVKLPKPQKVYNMFGIKAIDSDPVKYGSEYAYKQGWFTVDKAILGGAKYISNDYISNPKYNQDTIYKMRWNYILRWHQYATDIGWVRKQIARINFSKIIEQCKNVKPIFEIPQFK